MLLSQLASSDPINIDVLMIVWWAGTLAPVGGFVFIIPFLMSLLSEIQLHLLLR